MHIFYRTYFINFHGEKCSRLSFDQTVHGWRYHPSVSTSILAPLPFAVPMSNVRLLHRIFVDRIVNTERWNKFVSKLVSQLEETRVLAIVLVNANIGFLSKEPQNSAQQFFTYMSLTANVASIILSLTFMAHSRTDLTNTPFKNVHWHPKHGLERVAIIYGLSYALLMMCFFFAAFATQWCYDGTTATRASTAAIVLFAVFLVAWCIWYAWVQTKFWWFQPDPNQVEHKEGDEDNKVPPRVGGGVEHAKVSPIGVNSDTNVIATGGLGPDA